MAALRRRALRRARRPRSRSPRPWWQLRFLDVARLEAGATERCAQITRRIVGKALVYNADIVVDTYSVRRRVAIVFRDWPQLTAPLLFVDGSTCSPHRYRDFRPTRLCVWFPGDDPQLRWTFEQGLAGLLDDVRFHLFQEAWWRDTGEWLGPEAGHPPASKSDLNIRKRVARLRCWCGSKRAYTACHGSIATTTERQALGIAG